MNILVIGNGFDLAHGLPTSYKEFLKFVLESEDMCSRFQKNGLGEYKKNDEKIFEKVTSDGKIHMAIDNCKLMEKINENGQASQRNPMTQVYKVVEGLKEYLE